MKKEKEFNLEQQEYIELDKLLKLLGLVESGGEAHREIESGRVKVNSRTEFRKRNKLRPGDEVEFNGIRIRISL